MSLDNMQITILILIYLSPAFDILHHTLIIHRLESIGVTGIALKWCSSFLSDIFKAAYNL